MKRGGNKRLEGQFGCLANATYRRKKAIKNNGLGLKRKNLDIYEKRCFR